MTPNQKINIDLFSLYGELDLSRLLDMMADRIKKHLCCEEASIFLYNPQKECLYFEIVTGEKKDLIKQIVLSKGEGIAGWVAEHKQTLIIDDVTSDQRFSSRSDQKSSFHTRSIIAAPVLSSGSLIGVLEGINKQDGHFTGTDEELITIMARFTAVPLQNALLFHQLRKESTEKDLLLRLAKEITLAIHFEDIFPSLRELIVSQSDAVSILLSIPVTPDKTDLVTLLSTENVQSPLYPYHFEFQSPKEQMGHLKIVSRHPLSEESQRLFRGLAGFLALLTDKLEMQEERIQNEKTKKELEIARFIQQSFLITSPPPSPHLQCSFVNIPSSRVGGDYYDLINLSSDRLLFTIADIAGHGIPASLLMAIFRANFCYHAQRDTDIQQTIARINDLIAETTDPSQYLTAFCGCFDPQSMHLHYINAGHPPPLLIRGEQQLLLESNNFTIGMFPGLEFTSSIIDLQNEDLLFLYTDGVVETEDETESSFGLERCHAVLARTHDQNLDFIKNQLLQVLNTFHGKAPFEDDITLMLLRVLG